MSVAKFAREKRRQLGQFFTPAEIAADIVGQASIPQGARILEPSFGKGVFIDALLKVAHRKNIRCGIWGCEIDEALFGGYHSPPAQMDQDVRLHRGDFFHWMPQANQKVFLDARAYAAQDWQFFDLVVGNPPFGGSIDAAIQDRLDSIYGWRCGEKIKKETYSFFVVKAIDLLKPGGRLLFICSDTFLTINTMRGLRNFLMENGATDIREVPGLFDDTDHPMVLLDFVKGEGIRRQVSVRGKKIDYTTIAKTDNLSWQIDEMHAKYFSGVRLGDFIVASSGMTIGKNEIFLRKVLEGRLEEHLRFDFFDDPIRLEREKARARLSHLSDAQIERIRKQESCGATRRNVRWSELSKPRVVQLPHPDYCWYNKANSAILYAPPDWAIFWKDEGDAVRTFKKNGNWYLHGVGGKPYFKQSGFTWSLISSRMNTKFLPEGYILDSGSPCAFCREGVPFSEIYFIMGWTLTNIFSEILKRVINHTRNIQGKDIERMPYPVWIGPSKKQAVIRYVSNLVESAMKGNMFRPDSPEIVELNRMYAWSSFEHRKGDDATPCAIRFRQIQLFGNTGVSV
jgi:tRNA1(Val) A37 N6-methylase TrmN6